LESNRIDSITALKEAIMKDKDKVEKRLKNDERKAQNKIRESALLYHTLFRQSPDGILIIDNHGDFIDFNEAAHRQLGYSREEFKSLHLSDIDPFQSPEEIQASIKQVLDTGSAEFDVKHRSKAGEVRDVHVITQMIDLSGQTVFYTIWRDITEHKYAEEKLRESEEKYRLIFRDSPIGIFNYDDQLHITDCNDSFINILQSSRKDLIGLDMKILRDQRVLPAIREAIKGTEGIYEGLYRATTSSAEVHIAMHTAPIVGQDNKIKGGVGIVEDITEQIKMKDSLQEQKKFAENLIENSAVATFVLDAQHKIVLWNKACEALTGISSADMIGTNNQWRPFYRTKRPSLADVVLNGGLDKLPGLYTTYEKSALVPNGLHAEGWYEDLHGNNRYIHIDAAPIYDGKGELIAVIETLRDITDRKYAEEEVKRNYDTQAVINSLLRLSLEKVPLEDILNRALDLILSIPWLVLQSRGAIFLIENDPESLVLKAQRNIEKQIQKMCERVPIGKCLCGQAALTQKIEFVDSVDERHEISYDAINPHGHYCVPIIFTERTLGVVNVYVNAGHKGNEQEEELLVTIANTLAGIIVRRQAEDSLIESEHKLQAITDTAADAIILIDHEEKVIYWNASASSMLGYQPEEIMGKNIMVIIPLRYKETHAQAFEKFIETGQGALLGKTYEVFAVRKDGMEIPVELAISGIRLKGKWHAAGIIRDISERKKLESQLMQAQKMEAVGQLSGGIAHDFNNILSAIIGYGNILQMKMKEDDSLRPYVEHLLEAADRAANLTHSLLAFSRKQILNPRPTDLNEIIRRVEKLLRRVIGEDIELYTVFKQDAVTVKVDSGQIEQALMNLATNARDAMPHGGSLRIETEVTELDNTFARTYGYGEVGRYVVVSVTDTGMGMDGVTRQRIFEPFFTTKEVGKGTGLGLSMVYGTVKQHQGFINVYSEPGKGTTFKIYLPLIDTEHGKQKITTTIPENKLSGGVETVLIAEDDESLRTLFRTVLTEFGYYVIEAEDGIDAVIKFKNNKDIIKIILLDMIMPKKSGKEAYEEIIKVRPDIKVLFMSGYTTNIKSAEELLQRGIEFILKPVSPGDLLKRIRACLDA
jgi:PAS domain S-box-containing protein